MSAPNAFADRLDDGLDFLKLHEPSEPVPHTFRERAANMRKRGIRIIPLQVQSKDPCTAHAAYDATTDPVVIASWVKNYDPASNCGAVARFDGFWFLDDDLGTLAQKYKSDTGQDLPSTFAVKTSRGFHYYFLHDAASRLIRYDGHDNSGVIEIPGYKGEARCNNQYVVAPGSIHPTGAVYEVRSDARIAVAPVRLLEWLQKAYALSESLKLKSDKQKIDRKTDPGFGRLFDAVGYRPLVKRINALKDVRVHIKMELKPGKVSPCPMPDHKHRDYSDCFGAMKDAPALLHCLGNCQWSGDVVSAVYQLDGGSAKYKNMYDAARAICKEEGLNFDDFFPPKDLPPQAANKADDAAQQSGGSPPSVEEYESPNNAVTEYPQVGDDLISQYARLATQGTAIPFGHVREDPKIVLAFCLADSIRFPGHDSLYLRGWHFNLGDPETGKTAAWVFVKDRWFRVLSDRDIWTDKLSSYGSLQYLTKGFEDHPRMLLYVTEGNTLANSNEHIPAIFGGLSDLYDQPEISAGSYRNKSARCVAAQGSCAICITPDDFIKSMQGKGVIGGGVLPRWTMSESKKIIVDGDWPVAPERELRDLQSKMLGRFNDVTVIETDEARVIRDALKKEMDRSEVGRHGKRLIEHYKRECLMSAVFSGVGIAGAITKEIAASAAEWTRYQLHLRIAFWPIDAGNDVERMCSAMRALLTRAHPRGVSLTKLKDAANVYREGSGGIEAFGRAYRAMIMNEEMRKIGKNKKGKHLFGLARD